jgi:hypothetical protein
MGVFQSATGEDNRMVSGPTWRFVIFRAVGQRLKKLPVRLEHLET